MVLALVWKSPLGRTHLFSYSCHFFLKFWHGKIKLSHQNLLFKYKTVPFYTGIKTPSGLVCFRLLQPWKAPFLQRAVPQPSRPASCWQSCQPLRGNDKFFSPASYLSLGTCLKVNAELLGSCLGLPKFCEQVRLDFEHACLWSSLKNLLFLYCLASLHLSNPEKERRYQEINHN